MSRIFMYSAAAAALLSSGAYAESVDHPPALTDIITVSGQRIDNEDYALNLDHTPPSGPDTAGLIARLPGGAGIGNGMLSGQVQYRGLFGHRVGVRIDGQSFASGGPNLMDPPLHYAPPALLDRLELARGVSPVRDGPGLAGGLNAVFKRVDFNDGEGWEGDYDFTLGGRSVDNSFSLGGVFGASSDTIRLQGLFSIENGDDVDYPGGSIKGTQHERNVFGLGAGWRNENHELGLDLRRQETGPTGNPPFAMDIRYFDTDTARLRYAGDWEGIRVEASLSTASVEHAMNNFSLRPAPAPMRQRQTFADSETLAGDAAVIFDALSGELRLGADFERADHDVTITNPNNPGGFFLNSFPDIEIARTGVYGEWLGAFGPWGAELGLRADWHEAEAGEASTGAGVPMGPTMLAASFNAGTRSWDDVGIDAVARLWRDLSETTRLRVNLARKTRAATYVERFAWLPTPASGGLADGNTYIGDRDLDLETAWIAEAGFDWATDRAYARPTAFYRRVEDYIQGVAFDDTPGVINSPVEMVSSMNGDPTPLRFANTGAELYGFDMDFGWRLDEAWRVDGVASYVRGERTDISDNLYRVAPPSLRLGLTREGQDWSATFEALAVAEQDEVSATNSEAPTDGYVVLGLFGEWEVTPQFAVSAGVDNLLDESYTRHLAGYNRNGGGDVGLGERLPGEGRSFGLRLHVRR